MKFLYADSLDYIDPEYNFIEDRHAPLRRPYWDDAYAHEFMDELPYHGILVSRGIVGDGPVGGGKYTSAQGQRFRREGARAFLRLDSPRFNTLDIFGDCGAFTYHREEIPPYTAEGMLEFYDDAGFTHGCSVDHIIFEFNQTNLSGMQGGTEESHHRFEITMNNAEQFLRLSGHMTQKFTPLGVIQGWSPGSMAEAGRRLCAMGYKYLAIGGTVPLKTPQIKACLSAIRAAIPAETKIHVLGFAKADDITDFTPFNITSFDTTSPLIRAFKDRKSNYYLPRGDGKLDYFTAIRVPQAIENPKLQRLAKEGNLNQEYLQVLEKKTLKVLRDYDKGYETLESAVEVAVEYGTPIMIGADRASVSPSKIQSLANDYRRTLREKPWKQCACRVCREASIEVVIFRASNRNKRRGIHNIGVFKSLVDDLQNLKVSTRNEKVDLFCD